MRPAVLLTVLTCAVVTSHNAIIIHSVEACTVGFPPVIGSIFSLGSGLPQLIVWGDPVLLYAGERELCARE